MNNFHPTDLRYRLLLKKLHQEQGPVMKKRAEQVALLQGLGTAADVKFARQHDAGTFEHWPHP